MMLCTVYLCPHEANRLEIFFVDTACKHSTEDYIGQCDGPTDTLGGGLASRVRMAKFSGQDIELGGVLAPIARCLLSADIKVVPKTE